MQAPLTNFRCTGLQRCPFRLELLYVLLNMVNEGFVLLQLACKRIVVGERFLDCLQGLISFFDGFKPHRLELLQLDDELLCFHVMWSILITDVATCNQQKQKCRLFLLNYVSFHEYFTTILMGNYSLLDMSSQEILHLRWVRCYLQEMPKVIAANSRTPFSSPKAAKTSGYRGKLLDPTLTMRTDPEQTYT